MEHRIVLRVVVLAAVLAFVSACTGAKQARSAKVVPERLLGGTLRVGVCCAVPRQMETPTFLDPQAPFVVANGHREFFRCCLSRTLLSYTGRPTASGGTVLHPDLAIELPEVSPDRLTWTFRLQPGIRYAPPMENMEITSPDIVRAIERTTTPSIGTEDYISVFEMIEGVRAFADGEAATIGGLETPDDLTLRVQLTEVTNDLGYRFALPATAPIPPSPSDASARFGVATGHDNGYGPFLVASGPYMIEGGSQLDPSAPPKEQEPVSGFVPGSSLTLVRNPSWSRETDGLRKAYVNRIEVEVIDRAEATRAVEAGSLDVLLDGPAPPEQVERFEADPTLRDRVFRERCNFVSFAPMRLSTPPFDDVHVRRAANYAFDVERAAKLAASGGRWACCRSARPNTSPRTARRRTCCTTGTPTRSIPRRPRRRWHCRSTTPTGTAGAITHRAGACSPSTRTSDRSDASTGCGRRHSHLSASSSTSAVFPSVASWR
jgi:ABC-type transport system substrate-binding protein